MDMDKNMHLMKWSAVGRISHNTSVRFLGTLICRNLHAVIFLLITNQV